MNRINGLKTQLVPDSDPGEPSLVGYETRGGVAIVTLNDPKTLNALSRPMIRQICGRLALAASDPTVKAVVVRSAGKVFCAGANIKDFVNDSFEASVLEDPFFEMKLFFQSFKKPLVAAVNNLALGGGFELALFCDLIVCNKDCRLGFPEIKLGLFPGLGGTLVARTVGRYNAARLILTGEPISAAEAKRLLLVSEVTETPEECQALALALAEKMAGFALTSLVLAKRALRFSAEESGFSGTVNETGLFNPLFETRAGKEGIKAFVEKRKPDFSDK